MSLTVSLIPVEVAPPETDNNHEGCLICTTSRTPTRAYRPHTLDTECWCTQGADGSKVISTCWVFRAYLAT